MTEAAAADQPLAISGSEPACARTVFVHATGFCKETLLPVAESLDSGLGGIDAVHIDQRGHGASTPHSGPFDWDSLARDVLNIARRAADPPVGVGHSSGAAAIARAEILEPGTFSHVVLVEPIAFPGPFEVREIPLAIGAERRRRAFESREAAWTRFHEGPFSDWDESALSLYVSHGFEATDEGWTLRCAPSVEAEFYRQASNVDTWDRLGEIRCPVTVISGEHSTSHVDPFLGLLLDQFVGADSVILPGVGHLAPMEDPPLVASTIASAVKRYASLPTSR